MAFTITMGMGQRLWWENANACACVLWIEHVRLICILRSICFLKTIHQNCQCGSKYENVVVFLEGKDRKRPEQSKDRRVDLFLGCLCKIIKVEGRIQLSAWQKFWMNVRHGMEKDMPIQELLNSFIEIKKDFKELKIHWFTSKALSKQWFSNSFVSGPEFYIRSGDPLKDQKSVYGTNPKWPKKLNVNIFITHELFSNLWINSDLVLKKQTY